MRVLFVITTLGMGGAETQVVALASRLKANGWDPTVVSLMPDGALVPQLAGDGIPVHDLGMRRGVPDPRAIRRLARLVRAIRPDIVHSHMVHANLLARTVRPFAPVPALVCTAHNVDEEGRLREVAYRLTDGFGDLLTNVSRHATERYARLRIAPGPKLRYVPNGIDCKRFSPDAGRRVAARVEFAAGDRFVWLAVGRLDVQKDPESLVRAFAIHARDHPGVMLLVAGEGPLRGRAEDVAHDAGIERDVRFLGGRGDVADLMRAADGFVLASRWEGLPMVALEASASALPVVATAVGGTVEIVEQDRSGVLVPPHDPAALAEALTRVARMSQGQRSALGEAGRALVSERYDLGLVTTRWEAIYREVSGQAARGPRSAA